MAVRRYSITLTAEEALPIHAVGTVIAPISSTGAFAIAPDDRDEREMAAGHVHKEGGYKYVRVRDLSGAGNTVVLYLGDGDVSINQTATTISGTVSVTEANDTFESAGAVTVTTSGDNLKPSTSMTVSRILLRADPGNSEPIYIVESTTKSVPSGIPLWPGEFLELPMSDQVAGKLAAGAPDQTLWRSILGNA